MKIVITEWNWPNGLELLEQAGCQVQYDPGLWKSQALLQAVAGADALIVRNQTRVTAELIAAAPGLKVIGRLGVGLDNIDLEAAKVRGIPVIAARNANADSVAEYVAAAMLHAGRRLAEAADSVRGGGWERNRFTLPELAGKTLGLVGVGEIGHRTAAKAKALGLRVLGHDPQLLAYDYAVSVTGILPVSLERLLEESDYISLHVPLLPSTRNLMDASKLARMKRGSYLINTSRGGVVDEAALYEALKGGRLAGAVLDVLTQEPPEAGHPLLSLDNCWITPHVAGLTTESQERTAAFISQEVLAALAASRSKG
ncbi:MAG: phosphoglycerate dehydrogenase [Paenibacillaceae bacterium]|jgi:D-3-phosphoglycerate dehydrogenase/(S)-sulfolactate dehydrogenase|nr:phosphoglycerate dehydrogenase [Paenibacillaceae bacterium]